MICIASPIPPWWHTVPTLPCRRGCRLIKAVPCLQHQAIARSTASSQIQIQIPARGSGMIDAGRKRVGVSTTLHTAKALIHGSRTALA